MTSPLLLNCESLSKSYGTRDLFLNLSLSVFSGDRLGLIGPNGSGKSTLLKIIAGIEKADTGTLSVKKGLRVGYVPQTCDFPDLSPEVILFDAIAQSEQESYEKEQLVQVWLSKLGFQDAMRSAAHLSGGWKKKLSLAEQLINSPDLLLLDEPTNHLDLEGVLWLEKFLQREAPAYLIVSHDRYFLQNMTNRVIELNPAFPQGALAIEGSYAHFLEKKEEFLKGQLSYERSLLSKARREEEWLRRSPKARTTKSKSRVDEAHELLKELADVKQRNVQKRIGIDFVASERETKKLLVAKNISKQMNDHQLFHKLDFTLSPGTRLGLMGSNGSGKTTLLRLIAGELPPDQGTIKRADNLKVVYFDQHRAQISDDVSLRDALCPQGDYVHYHGQSIHINGWCKRFLFSPDILGKRIGSFSGGERARIVIAHLMLQPADLLLLDEPTNDLDIPTLETLEENLLDFPGAVVLITHDRCMLDRLCNSVLNLGNPGHDDFYADYKQWLSAQKIVQSEKMSSEKKTEGKPQKKKLSFAEKQEYDQMEDKILGIESEIHRLNQLLENEEIAQSSEKLAEVCLSIGLAEAQVEQLYLRWDELSKKTSS